MEPCHGVAHRVMGSSFNPQYQWDQADDDLSWQHFMEARRCDPTDAFTWVESIVPAMRHGQSDVADEAISNLLETGAFPPGSVEFNRWMLDEVPDNAVLVTWGDLDTFPAWGLQLSDGVRPDVAVVNVNLLSAWWYATLIRDRYDLPLVANDAESHTIESTLRAWRSMNAEGTFGRPLVFATTVPREIVADGPGRLQLESGHRSIRVSPTPTPLDSALSAATSIATLRGAGLHGTRRHRKSAPLSRGLRIFAHLAHSRPGASARHDAGGRGPHRRGPHTCELGRAILAPSRFSNRSDRCRGPPTRATRLTTQPRRSRGCITSDCCSRGRQ